jgi:hypothetical protein
MKAVELPPFTAAFLKSAPMATACTTSVHQLVLQHWWLPINTMPAKEIFTIFTTITKVL